MSAVTDTLAVRQYQGDSIAGGSQAYGITIDPSPIDKLATQTFYEKRDLWERKNKKDDAAALEMGKLLAIDISNTNPEIYNYLDGLKKEISGMMKDGMPDYQKDPDAYRRFQGKVGDFNNLVQKAVATDIKVEKKRVENNQLPEQQRLAANEYLDASIKKSFEKGVDHYLRQGSLVETEYKPDIKDFTIKTPKDLEKTSVTTYVIGANDNKEYEVKYTDYNKLFQIANFIPAEQSEDFIDDPKKYNSQGDYELGKAKSKLRKSFEITGEFTEQTVAKRNEIASLYYQKEKEYAANPVGEPPYKPDFIQAAENYNEHAKKINDLLKKQQSRGGNPLLQPVPLIDLKDDVRKEELIFLKMVSETDQSIGYDEKGQHTGAGITRENNLLDDKRAGQRIGLESSQLKLEALKSGIEPDGKGGWKGIEIVNGREQVVDIPQNAYNAIVGNLNDYTKNSSDKIIELNKIPAEQVASIDKSLTVFDKGEYRLTDDARKKYYFYKDDNGNIVVQEGKGEKAKIKFTKGEAAINQSGDAIEQSPAVKDRKGERSIFSSNYGGGNSKNSENESSTKDAEKARLRKLYGLE